MKPKHPWRWIAGGLFLLAAAAVAAPYFGADGFAATIQQELERTLGRKVEIHGESHFRLLPRPGFSVADVVIHEDPKIGVEQFAYVPVLHVDVGASSIWRWRIEFASLRLDSPSINLMKAADGRWNVQSLAERARREAVGSLPGIEVSEGRLNFKLGDLKSVYYLAETDLSVEASSAQRLSLRFSGVPARTDRPAHGFGRLSGRGSIALPEHGPGRLELSLALERTAAAEILTLVQGRGAGLGGFVRSQARLVGGWSNIEISGRMELDDFERWGWLFPGNSGWGLDYKGALDLENQTLEIETRAPERAAAALPLSVRLRATRLSADTRWGALITLRGVPLDSLRSLAEETGSEIPAGLPLQGTLTGALGYSPAGGFRGKVAVADASVTLPDLPPLRLEDLTVVADGSEMSLGPATLRVGDAHSARLEARFQAGSPAMDVRLVSSGIELAHLQAGWSRFTGSELPPLLSVARGGIVKGSLHFQRTGDDHPPLWTGDLDLSDVEVNVAGLAHPVRIGKAALRMKGADTSLSVSAGSIAAGAVAADPISFTATHVRPAAERRPHQLRIEIPSLTAGDLERTLGPALRRNQGFLARTLRLGTAPVPEWLRARNLVAAVRVGTFEIGDYRARESPHPAGVGRRAGRLPGVLGERRIQPSVRQFDRRAVRRRAPLAWALPIAGLSVARRTPRCGSRHRILRPWRAVPGRPAHGRLVFRRESLDCARDHMARRVGMFRVPDRRFAPPAIERVACTHRRRELSRPERRRRRWTAHHRACLGAPYPPVAGPREWTLDGPARLALTALAS